MKKLPNNIQIRQATLADKQAIFSFLRLAYPDRWQFKFPDRWEWEFEHNPFLQGENLPIWIALDGEQVIGQSCALIEPLIMYEKETMVGWGVDFSVLPEYRGQGLGTHLQQANNDGNEIFMSLSMALVAAKIKSKIGLQPLNPVPVFTKLVHHEPGSVLQTLAGRTKMPVNILRGAGLHRLGAKLLTARDARRDRKLLTLPAGEVELTPVQHFGPEVDVLWERASQKFSALIRRDSKYLNWKFTQQPHVQHERIIAQRAGRVEGYVVFRRALPPERNAGLILDVFADPEDRALVRTLFGVATQRLRDQGVAYIQAASSVRTFQEVLQALGFKQTQAFTPMIRAGLAIPETGWLLGKGDHDWDQYPLA
ncbi:MAG: GNAT family N-acetyltransferase [Anaerolineae bacterium]|nr:GNAT family N-acetyltransferase [Anaerolineae bacterium]